MISPTLLMELEYPVYYTTCTFQHISIIKLDTCSKCHKVMRIRSMYLGTEARVRCVTDQLFMIRHDSYIFEKFGELKFDIVVVSLEFVVEW